MPRELGSIEPYAELSAFPRVLDRLLEPSAFSDREFLRLQVMFTAAELGEDFAPFVGGFLRHLWALQVPVVVEACSPGDVTVCHYSGREFSFAEWEVISAIALEVARKRHVKIKVTGKELCSFLLVSQQKNLGVPAPEAQLKLF